MTKSTANGMESESGETLPGMSLEDRLRQRIAELEDALRKADKVSEALRASDAQFRSMAQHSLLGMAIIADGRYTYTNPAYNDIFGYSSDEMLSLDPLALVAAEDRAFAGEKLRQAQASMIERAEFTLHVHRKDGKVLDVEFSGSAMQVDGKRLLLLLGKDITARVDAERRLRESEETLSTVATYAHDAIVMIDNEGRISFWNGAAEAIFGYTGDEAIGQDMHALLAAPQFRHSHEEAFAEFRKTGKGAVIGTLRELSAARKDGTVFPIEVAVSAVNLEGKWNAVGIVRDITDRKAAEKQLRIFRALVDQSNDAIEVIDATTLRLVDANERACTDLGYSREELLSLSVFDIDGYDDRERVDEIGKHLEQDGFVVMESLHRRKDGSLFPVELSLKMVALDKPYIVSVARDITDRKAAEKQLRMFRTLIDQSNDAILVVDARTQRLVDVNERACTNLGYGRAELLSLSVPDIDARHDTASIDDIRKRLEHEGFVVMESLQRRKDGSVFPVELSLRMVVLDKPYVVSVARDITKRKQDEEKLKQLQALLLDQSIHDPLTGLYNRRYLEEALARELIVAERKGRCVSAIMGDLDHFKRVNDEYGHRAGDEVLRTFGALLKEYSRGSDVDCRFGGEEFLLLLPDMNVQAARERAEQLRRKLASTPIHFEGVDMAVTGSFGVACYPGHARTGDGLISAADKALYAAKEAGRNRVEVYAGAPAAEDDGNG
jgi:diguanylate cyclase (GGDEF)-like protein/PAS domain S-box-containing protein